MKRGLIIIFCLYWFCVKKGLFCLGKEYTSNDSVNFNITRTPTSSATKNLVYIQPSESGFHYIRRDGNNFLRNSSNSSTTDKHPTEEKILFGGFYDGDCDDDDKDCGKSLTKSQKWAYFGIVIGIVGFTLLVAVLGIFLSNIKRIRSGRRPVYGTSWLTPPSYWQSQRDYNTNRGEEPTEYVPTYSEQPNEDVDLGYYDERGEFHLSGQNNEYTASKSNNEGDEEGIEQVNTNEETLINSDNSVESNSESSGVGTAPEAVVTADHSHKNTVLIKSNVLPADFGETENHP